MKIQPPPFIIPGSIYSFLNACDLEYLQDFVNYFNTKVFKDRYYPQFEWFKEDLSGIESITNLGCGSGRETFALMWKIKPTEALGIDNNSDKIDRAKGIARFRQRFSSSIIPSVKNQQAAKLLQDWYDGLPIEIREGGVPQFIHGDISVHINLPEDHFTLVYCRYTLWTIIESNKNNLSSVCQNIFRILKSGIGRVVIIEPSTKGSNSYDFVNYFRAAGLKLDRLVEDKSCLGWLEPFKEVTDPIDPKGYIFSKL